MVDTMESSRTASSKKQALPPRRVTTKANSVKKNVVLWASGLVGLLVLTFGAAEMSTSWGHIITMTLIWGGLATAWNVVGGFAGQISLGHAGFFGIGAYTSTLLYINLGISPWIGMILAIVLGGFAAWLIGLPSFRFRGPYFALSTLAIGLILFNLSVYLRELTLGQVGVPIPYSPGFSSMIFADRWQYTLLAGAFLLVCIAVCTLVARSRLGYQLAAIRDDEQAARALGVNASRSKLIAAVISGGMAGGVGVIYSQYILFISPDSVFGINVSIEAVVLTVVGGAGVVLGPILGAALLIPVSTLMLAQFGGSAPGLHTLLYGAVLIIVVLILPGGIHSIITRGIQKIRAMTGGPRIKEGDGS